MFRRWLLGMATMTLAGCVCASDPVTETAYAPMARYPSQLTACIDQHDCESLCRSVFQIWDAAISRCELKALDLVPAAAPGTPGAPVTPDELQRLRGATVRVTYVPDACSDDGSVWGGGDDGSSDGGSTCDDGSCGGSSDDGSTCDDGSCDGSSDDGSTCDDGSCDGSSDDGSTDDGSTDGGDGSPRKPPPAGARHVAGRR
jgi:hypothetical protein